MLFRSLALLFGLGGVLCAQQPAIAGASPDTALVGSSFAIVVYGNNFQPGVKMFWNNTEIGNFFNGPLSMVGIVPPSLTATAGTAQITIRNPGGSTSNPATFTVRTTSVTPNFVGATTDVEAHLGQQIRKLAVVGTNIQPGVVLSWNGATFPSEAGYPFLVFPVPIELMLTPGPANLTLTNPGGSASNALTLTIPARRTLTSISPAAISPATGFTLTATGTGFEPGDVVFIDAGGDYELPPTQFISGTQVRLSAPASLILPTGTYGVILGYFGPQAGTVPVLAPDQLTVAVYVAGNVLPLTVGPPGCTYSLSTSGATIGTAATARTVQVNTQAGCNWTATSPSNAVTITAGGSGSGTGTVSYSVQASTTARSVTLTIAGLPFTINQVTACIFGLAPSSAATAAAGAAGSFGIEVTGSACAWTATSNAPWLQIVSGGSGTGGGTVNYSVAANASNVGRVGTIVAGGQTFTMTQSGNGPCTYSLVESSQAFTAAGGAGTAAVQTPAGCPWSAASNVPWVTIAGATGGSGNGSLGYSVAANPGSGRRTGSLTVAGLTYAVIQAGTASSVSCSVSAPAPPDVALEGRTELAGDVRLSCTGLSGAVVADISLAANTDVTNTMTGANTTDAVLLVNETNPRNAQLSSYGTLRWPGVTLTADNSGTAIVRITNVRVDASLLVAPVNLRSTPITALLSVQSQTPIAVTNSQPTVANAVPTLGFQQPVVADAAGLTRLTVAYSEATLSAFRTAAPPLPATRLRLAMSNIPPNAVVYAPVFPNEGTGQAQLFSADANGAGGTAVTGSPFNGGTYQQLTVSNGVATATWVVLAANLSEMETRTFALLFQAATVAQVNGIAVGGSLAPVSTVAVASATAPVPRYRDLAAPQKLVNLRVSTTVSNPASAPIRPANGPLAPAVGSNITFITQVLNDDSSQTATNVILRSNVPSGLAIVSCTASNAQPCTTANGLATVTTGSLPPGASVTVTEVVAPGTFVTDEFVLSHDAGVTSDDPNSSVSGTRASTSTILLNGQPVVVGTVPASGTGSTQTFTFQFSHPLGYQTLGVVNVLINNVLDGRNACYLAYSLPATTLFLVNDAGDAGGPFAGGISLGGSGTIENSQCTVGLVSVVGEGTLLTLKLSITFKSGFGGNRILFVAARDQGAANSDWQGVGVWQAPFVAPGAIGIADLTPGRGSVAAGASQQFRITVNDTKGASDIGIVNVLINSFIDGRKACYLAYSAPANTLFLVNDSGDAGGPFAGSMLLNGANAGIQNSQCSVTGSGSSVAFAANQMTLTLNISFAAGFAGNRVVYVAGRDSADGNNTGWQALGTLGIQ